VNQWLCFLQYYRIGFDSKIFTSPIWNQALFFVFFIKKKHVDLLFFLTLHCCSVLSLWNKTHSHLLAALLIRLLLSEPSVWVVCELLSVLSLTVLSCLWEKCISNLMAGDNNFLLCPNPAQKPKQVTPTSFAKFTWVVDPVKLENVSWKQSKQINKNIFYMGIMCISIFPSDF
jgi:hypothetical protein